MRFQSPFDLLVESILEDLKVNSLSDLMCLDGLNMSLVDFKESNIDIALDNDGSEIFVYRRFLSPNDCVDGETMNKKYRLMSSDGMIYESMIPGEIGGHKKQKIYGELDCYSARNALARGHYVQQRVFFKDEESAIAAGYRPCGKCMKEKHAQWKLGGTPNSIEYPWKILPRSTPK